MKRRRRFPVRPGRGWYLPLAFIKAANWHPRDPKPLDPPCWCVLCLFWTFSFALFVCLFLSHSILLFLCRGRAKEEGRGREEGGVFWSPSRFCLVSPRGSCTTAEYHFSFCHAHFLGLSCSVYLFSFLSPWPTSVVVHRLPIGGAWASKMEQYKKNEEACESKQRWALWILLQKA